MSIRCQNWVYENSEARGNDRLVLLAIADEADDDGTGGHPGIDRISHKARVPKRTTMRCLDRLEEGGHLVVIRPKVKGRGHFNTYVVVMEKGATSTPISSTPETGQKGREKARIGAQHYVERPRPIDPLTQDPTTTETPPTPPARLSDFERWYAAFPLHVGRGAAEKAWAKALSVVGGDAERLIEGALRYRHDPNRDQEYTCYPATWLNKGRWDDDPLPPRNRNGAGTAPSPGMAAFEEYRRQRDAR